MRRVWEDHYDGSMFYVYPDGVSNDDQHRAFPPTGWRYRVVMHDHEGEAFDCETGEEWVVRPREEWPWWDDHDYIARAVIEDKDDCYRGRLAAD